MKVKMRFKNMDVFERAGTYLRPRLNRQLLVFLLPLVLLFVAWPQNLGPVESIMGVLMCGLSASFLFGVVSRLVDREARASDTAITVAGATTPGTRVRGGEAARRGRSTVSMS